MEMKTITKNALDKTIETTREFWKTGKGVMKEISLDCAKECEIDWFVLSNFLDSLLNPSGLAPNATNKDIYHYLYMLGWEVVGNEKPFAD